MIDRLHLKDIVKEIMGQEEEQNTNDSIHS